ncbi:MAG TPA: hypothetical protein VJK52_03180 [Candidatus Nanoarchaeia archaeon]|nr:hypothetical protein [Candidatus Nanoarchaeia archaeon]
MKRRVMQIADSTQLISLPRKWSLQNSVKKGDELDVELNGNKLLITYGGQQPSRAAMIDFQQLGNFNKNYLSIAYHMGFDEVEIRFDEPKNFEEIQDRVKDCIGFEIVDQGPQYCLIRSITDVSNDEFDKVLRRVFLMLQALAKNSFDALSRGDFRHLDEVRALERTNNRLTDFCRRTLNKKGYPDAIKLPIIYSLICDLERIADDYKHICDYYMQHPTKPGEGILRCFVQVNQYLETFAQVFYKFEKERAQSLWEMGRQLTEQLEEYFNAKNVEERMLAHHLINITTKIYELTMPYFSLRF